MKRESDDAKKTIDKVRPTFQDIVHKRMLFVRGTEKMDSQKILLSRRKAAQLSHFFADPHPTSSRRSWTHVRLELAFEGFVEQKKKKRFTSTDASGTDHPR